MGSREQWWASEVLDGERWKALVQPTLERVAAARDRKRLPQALLLTGPVGLGREAAAVEAAALLCCPTGSEPWCRCGSCERVRGGTHPDVAAVLGQGASETIKIEQVRSVVDAAPGRPYESTRRIWIFDGVEAGRFGSEAANAFLKTLEEPPEHVRFILLAANPESVLPTIRSRCQQLALPGAVAVSRGDGGGDLPPELAALALDETELDTTLARVRSALEGAAAGEPLVLIRLARHLSRDERAFELVASTALEMACDQGSQDRGGDLAQLASELLAAERRCKALNLNRGRQLLACLLSFSGELQRTLA